MKSEMIKYVLIGFLLGVLVLFLFGANKETETYRLYTHNLVVHVLNTRTGVFETFIPSSMVNDYAIQMRFRSIGKAIPEHE